jgi:DNA invertase Pin-like site-specific DNA recombinase
MKAVPTVIRKLRCAVYTRKSTEEGLEQEFNSLDAQREACEAYVASQKAEGWLLVPDRYNDGGYSGGTLERPALKRLIADIEAKKVDVVVVYKIDRLSRSLMDFARLVEVFDRNAVTFVSVTQSFNTTTSMGRLTLNVLLSFAQFEREVIGERIRDKFAASRRKGMWMGGWAPLGYDIKDRKLVINETEAKVVRSIFKRFARGIQPQILVEELAKEGATNKSGKPIDKGYLYRGLHNRVYLGEAVHKGTAYPGEHAPIIERNVWDQAHALISPSMRERTKRTLGRTPALLKGLVFGPSGAAMTPAHTRKGGKLYRYYVSTDILRSGARASPIKRITAAQLETIVIEQIKVILQSPEIIVASWRAARKTLVGLTEREVAQELHRFDGLWSELFPAEQAKLIQLLVHRVDISEAGADVTLKVEGLSTIFQDLQSATKRRDAACLEQSQLTCLCVSAFAAVVR